MKKPRRTLLGRDRRRRSQIHPVVLVVAWMYLTFPGAGLIIGAAFSPTPLQTFQASLDPRTLVIIAICALTGIGLLLRKNWGYYLLYLTIADSVIVNLRGAIRTPNVHTFSLLGLSGVWLWLAWRFTRKDLRMPYISKQVRGFRRNRRKPLQVSVHINGHLLQTIDISDSGLRVLWPKCGLTAGDEVQIQFVDQAESAPKNRAPNTSRTGGITRLSGNEVSIAYRNNS